MSDERAIGKWNSIGGELAVMSRGRRAVSLADTRCAMRVTYDSSSQGARRLGGCSALDSFANPAGLGVEGFDSPPYRSLGIASGVPLVMLAGVCQAVDDGLLALASPEASLCGSPARYGFAA